MKFSCGLSDETKRKWHIWFAWYPVTVDDTGYRKQCRWLTKVERRGSLFFGSWYWQYRDVQGYPVP